MLGRGEFLIEALDKGASLTEILGQLMPFKSFPHANESFVGENCGEAIR